MRRGEMDRPGGEPRNRSSRSELKGSNPLKIRVLRLQPCPRSPPHVAGTDALRDNPFEPIPHACLVAAREQAPQALPPGLQRLRAHVLGPPPSSPPASPLLRLGRSQSLKIRCREGVRIGLSCLRLLAPKMQ